MLRITAQTNQPDHKLIIFKFDNVSQNTYVSIQTMRITFDPKHKMQRDKLELDLDSSHDLGYAPKTVTSCFIKSDKLVYDMHIDTKQCYELIDNCLILQPSISAAMSVEIEVKFFVRKTLGEDQVLPHEYPYEIAMTKNFNAPLIFDTSHIKHLKMGAAFNQPLQGLNFYRLKSIVFGRAFNQSLEGVEFPMLKCIETCYLFNGKLDGPAYQALEEVCINDGYHQPLNWLHNTNIIYLQLGINYDLPLTGIYLPRLKELKLYNRNTKFDTQMMPNIRAIIME